MIRSKLLEEPFPRALSDNDKTVLFIARKLSALILSSDKAVRNYAKSQAVEYHGMLWIMDKMLEEGLLIPSQASEHLKILVRNNIIYQNNASLHTEIDKRIKSWSKAF